VSRRDAPWWLLAAAVRLLPPGRRAWGSAMRAELAGIDARRERWEFAGGCTRALMTRSATARRIGYPLLTVAAVSVALWWTGRITYVPLHVGSMAVVLVLLAVAWLGRLSGPLGPVAGGPAARGLRAGGGLLLGVWTASLMVSMAEKNSAEQAVYGVPIFGVVLTINLVGLLALTARRSAATPRALTAGLAGAGLAVLVWTVAVCATPPIPVRSTPAVLLIVAGATAAAWAAGGGGRERLLAALCAGTAGIMLLLTVLVLLSTFGPATLIPDLASAALTPADDLEQSRREIQDPYVAVLLLGALVAALQSAVALGGRRPVSAVPDQAMAVTGAG
jgi:hypothetical protein